MNRKILFLTALSIVITVSAQAQSVKGWGVLAGYTSADQEWEPSLFDTKSREGFHAGIYAEWLNLPYVSVVTGLMYTQKGAGDEMPITGEDSPTVLEIRTDYAKFDYLSLPVLGKVSLPWGTLSPYLLAGPRLDILLGHSQDHDFMKSVNEEYEPVVVGLTAGAGVQAPGILPGNAFVEFRVNLDITEAFKGGNPNLVDVDIKNKSFDISLGVGL
jgi:hypothetical protein